MNCAVNVEVINELNSDHLAVIVELRNYKLETVDKTFLNYKLANWNEFRSEITKNLNINSKINNNEQIDHEVQTLTNLIQIAIKIHIPQTSFNNACTSLPEDIKKLIKLRNKFRKIAQRNQSKEVKKLKNKLSKTINKEIKDHFNNKWTKKLEKLTVKDNSLWKVVKNIKNKIEPKPTLHGKSGLAFGDEEKAREIGDHFEQVHHITEDLGDYGTERLVDNTYSNVKNKEILIEDIDLTSPKEI